LRRAKRALAAALTSALLVGVVSFPALAINDALVPGDDCAANNSEAVGHPAADNEQAEKVSPPFSRNNPGQSTGAEGSANSEATDQCPNASP
jgi:hypothetical protein